MSPAPAMRILFPLHGLCRWNGGIDLARLMVSALHAIDDPPPLTFALPTLAEPAPMLHAALLRLRRGGRDRTGMDDALMRSATAVAGAAPLVRVADTARGIAEAARISGASVVFPTMLPLPLGAPPAIGYIFDFQHRHLPANFSWLARWRRDRRFGALAARTAGIVVNSRHTCRDAVRYLDVDPTRVLSMAYSPYALPRWLDVDVAAARARYGLDGPYIMVCNQMWMHKDHPTALRAFALARDRLPAGARLVLTGQAADHRDPAYGDRLRALVHELGVGDWVDWLGLIPKPDQIALLRGALMLWQPTLFEGGPGGGAVYEATGLGVPVVVSDIEINRELDRGTLRFFRAGDAASLAIQALALAADPPARPDRAALEAASQANLRRLGTSIHEFLAATVARAASTPG